MDNHDIEAKLDSLTAGECRVLYFLCQGLPRKEIASRLFISERGVYYHIGNIYEKLGFQTLKRAERLHALEQVFCPLVLARVRGPEREQ
jgi:DNA-binding CsgD family transcriptional regulator